MRELLSRYGKFKAGYLWAFFTPLAQVAVLYGVWLMLQQRESSHAMPLVLMLMTGVLPFWVFRQTLREASSAIRKNKSLLSLPQVTIFDVTLAHTFLEMLTMVVVFCVAVGATRFMGEDPLPQAPLGILIGFALLWALGTGLGMIFAGISSAFPSAPKLANPLLGRPLFFTSGLFFTADMLPAQLREVLLYNPLLHVIEFIRSCFFRQFDSPYYDLEYPIGFALLLLTLGFATMFVNRRNLSFE